MRDTAPRLGGTELDPCLTLPHHKVLLAHCLCSVAGPGELRRPPPADEALALETERRWNQRLGHLVERHAHEVPKTAEAFHDWYRLWALMHEREVAPFTQFLARDASLTGMALFFVAEEKVDSHFDDLMALAQIGTSGTIKLAIAQNYWDEMGNGDAARVHTTMFDTSVRYMKDQLRRQGIDHDGLTEIPQVYANAGQLLMYGVRRPYWPRLIGALGILEYSASHRFQAMVDGCERLSVPDEAIAYQRAHIGIDEQHGEGWLRHVLMPLATQYPQLIPEIANGVITRLYVARAYYQAIHALLLCCDEQASLNEKVSSNA
jgi:hypothetical protein